MSRDPVVMTIKKRRLEANLTQAKLANMAGMSTKTYQRIEQGISDMRFSQYRAILRALRTTELDVILDVIGHESHSSEETHAALRLLPNKIRKHIIDMIIEIRNLD